MTLKDTFMTQKTVNFILSLCLSVSIFIFFPVQETFAQEVTSCFVTNFGNPPANATDNLPASCSRGRIPCTGGDAGYVCAYKNLVGYSSIGDGWGAGRNHKGVDLIASAEEPQYAIEDGVVVSVSFEGCNRAGVPNTPGARSCTPADSSDTQPWTQGRNTGWHVKTHDNNNRYHFYFHQIRKSTLQEGQIIHAGDIVGYTGTTGHSGTEHLHYQISYPCNDEYNCWSDPAVILRNWPNY